MLALNALICTTDSAMLWKKIGLGALRPAALGTRIGQAGRESERARERKRGESERQEAWDWTCSPAQERTPARNQPPETNRFCKRVRVSDFTGENNWFCV